MNPKDSVFLTQLFAPDFPLGKGLGVLKCLRELIYLLSVMSFGQWFHFAALCLVLIPKYTMVMPRRLHHLQEMIRMIQADSIPGAIVECGVWNGGSAAAMGKAVGRGLPREIWLFDSFEGLPKPGPKDGLREKKSFFAGWNKGAKERVQDIFARFGIWNDSVKIVPGWFQNTLSQNDLKEISLLHVDADWYDSVKYVLDTLFDKVSPGGIVVLDDYGCWDGCKQATHDFLQERKIDRAALIRVDRDAVYFRKPLLKASAGAGEL